MKHTKMILAALAAMSLSLPACGGEAKKDEKKPEAGKDAKDKAPEAKPEEKKPEAKPEEKKPEEAKTGDAAGTPPAGGAAAPEAAK